MSGQVAALDSERVVAHAQDGDAQDKDQDIVGAQAQEPCGASGAGSFSGFWRPGPKHPSLTPGSPDLRGPSSRSCHKQQWAGPTMAWEWGLGLSTGRVWGRDKTEPSSLLKGFAGVLAWAPARAVTSGYCGGPGQERSTPQVTSFLPASP